MTMITQQTWPVPRQRDAGPVVRLDGVSKAFGEVTALAEFDLEVHAGEFVCLIGASGCGKSTLLNLLAGLESLTEGRITRATSQPAVMFQDPALMPWLTAARNVELALQLAGVGRADRKTRTNEFLELVRLGGLGDKRPHELSGGMRQRVALARALASASIGAENDGPCLLLMDEPFAALDAITRDVLQQELLRIWRATSPAVLFVTHDVREAVRLGQRVVLLSSRPGRVVQQWSADGVPESALVGQINARLREVIGCHGNGSG
ncbi:NitT/TauT family transport system ATP-binding protein [Kibdelosporangium banguiense]|uniref:NitT/TauT family transport system ATP-binding protein n=1 Tax=Kibdelosporangium banguiense TaxID=1365924 RepID=A0ABS4TSC6_9PSEU|nr:ABC transporter ATP-binding protein [Kibdelosporangium banguiense]MBP2327314.1 NitT/TauT family transport system ATP-binding protein [Kibdelosporangium banguiense]